MGAPRVKTSWVAIMMVVALCGNVLPCSVSAAEEIKVSKADEMPERTVAEGSDLIGTPAPEFKNLEWLKGTKPLSMQNLKGKVVLIRFWLGDCQFCEGSAQALNYLDRTFRERGLTIIGIHHPKSPQAKKEEFVARNVRKLGFEFPIAIDNSWSTIDEYWLGKRKRSFTSASFLIDRHGLIRWIHPGGVLAFDQTAGSGFAELRLLIVKLLDEK